MKAPTNVYGPDGGLCEKGDEIPADWHDAMPDLVDHFDGIDADEAEAEAEAPVPSADEPGEPVKLTGATTRGRRGASA